ncbi:nitroreductase family protein [Candidatus Woesearchaeota archaeon]|jgi:nitroreductase|nr:nitroreductase family protein [Candidatus Woesearchaeota archaeon]
MNQTINIIKNRRSVRSYLAEQIKDEELKQILDSAIYAPTGRNHQPWNFTVIQNQELIKQMGAKTKEVMSKSKEEWISERGKDPGFNTFYNAPTIIIVSGRKNAYSPLTDCSAAIQNILLTAESLNIGSCWVGLVSHFFSVEEEVAKLKIPEGYEPYYAVCLGYKNPDAKVIIKERNKEVVNYIK